MFLADWSRTVELSDFNLLPAILLFGALLGPAIAVCVLLVLRERRRQVQ